MSDYVFCYEPQRKAVQNLVRDSFGLGSLRRLVGIEDGHRLAGLQDVAFVAVEDHPRPVPQELQQALLARGVIGITLLDKRRRAQRDRVIAAGGAV